MRLKRFGLADHRPELAAGLAHGALIQGPPAGFMGFLHVAALCNSLTNAGAGAVELGSGGNFALPLQVRLVSRQAEGFHYLGNADRAAGGNQGHQPQAKQSD